MESKRGKSAVLPVFLALAMVAPACGESDDDGGVTYERPQILPDNNPICMSYEPVTVDEDRGQNVLLRNDGRQDLVIESATLIDDARGHFTMEGVVPTTVETKASAHARFHYRPRAAGWDTAVLVVKSNAENYPTLRLFILALARPAGLAPTETYDPGPKPAAAFSPQGDETCPAELQPRR